MKHILIHIHRSFWITIVMILIALAIFIGLARFTTPYLTAHRAAIENLVSAVIRQPIQIETLGVTWQGYNPVLKAQNVLIFDDTKTHVLLKVDELDASLDLLHSMLNGSLQFGALTISGAKVSVHQTNNGLVVSGLGIFPETNQKENNIDTFIKWFFAAPRLSLNNIALNWYQSDGTLLTITDLDFDLRNRIVAHNLWGTATIKQTIGNPPYPPFSKEETSDQTQVKFALQLTGNVYQKDSIQARFYLAGENMLLSQWLRKINLGGYKVTKGLLNFEIWGLWQDQQLQKLQSLFTLRRAGFMPDDSDLPLSVPLVSANLWWQKDKIHKWELDTHFNQLTLLRREKIPGVTNLNGYIYITPAEGFAKLAGHAVKVDFGKLFHKVLLLTKLSGQVNWHQQNDCSNSSAKGIGWVVNARDVELQTSDAYVKGLMNLWLPADKSSPIINLAANYQMLGRKHLVDYLPVGILSPGLVNWLDRSIVHSEKTDSKVILRGPIHSYPFDHNEGLFLVDSQVQGVDLDYWPGWPSLKNISGQLIFRNRTMQLNVAKGEIYSTPLTTMRAEIPFIHKNVPAILHVDGAIAGNLQDFLRFAHESPLNEGALDALQTMEGSGPAQLQLHLTIPLEHAKEPTIAKGQILLQKDELTSRGLQLKKLTGSLAFTQDSLTAERLTAELWGDPLIMRITTIQQQPHINLRYGDLSAALTRSKDSWNLGLHGSMVDGQVTIPKDENQTLQASFQRLYLKPDSDRHLTSLNPSDIPKLNLIANDVHYGEKNLGRVQLQLNPVASGVEISGLKAVSPTFTLAASGIWHQLQNNQQSTQLQGNLTSNNVGGMLGSWGFPAAIKSKQCKLEFNLTWPSAAYDFSLNAMRGNLELRMQEGEIASISSEAEMKMDIGRLLSILSLESLTRRLKLDFSDLTTKGFPFDHVQGSFQLQGGNAYTRNTTIVGPIANVGMAGRIGLDAEDYDLMLNVTPKITSSLPAIVGIATSPLAPVLGLAAGPAGPIVGAATWIAGKMVSSAVNKIATDTYHMTGPWSNPRTVQVGNFWTKTKNAGETK